MSLYTLQAKMGLHAPKGIGHAIRRRFDFLVGFRWEAGRAGHYFWITREFEQTARFFALPRLGIEATFVAPVKLRVIAMASRITDRLRNDALNLPRAERAELACDLVQSLDGPVDSDAANAWDAEILRRPDQVAAGSTRIIDRAEFARRMRERISRL